MFERTVQPVLDVKDKPKPAQWAFLSLQHLFAMFGSTVLVPFLTSAYISSFVGIRYWYTFIHINHKSKILPTWDQVLPLLHYHHRLSTHSLGDMLVALFMSGLMYVIIGIFIKLSGTHWLMHLLPPVVVGPVIMVIGLSLAPTAVNMAMFENC